MIRAGLRGLVDGDPDLELTEETDECDVLVLSDASGLGGVAPTELPLPVPAPPLLVLTAEVEPLRSILTTTRGPFGVLPATASEADIRAAIRAVSAGMLVGTPRLVQELFTGSPSPSEGSGGHEELSPREAEVLQLLSLGLLNKEIGARLEISKHTVKYHISSIFAKLGASNRVEAIRAGIRRGLLEL
jgi:DNA-binding NarL/FixJ family response regulator